MRKVYIHTQNPVAQSKIVQNCENADRTKPKRHKYARQNEKMAHNELSVKES